MECQRQNPEFSNNLKKTFTHGIQQVNWMKMGRSVVHKNIIMIRVIQIVSTPMMVLKC